MDIKANAIQGKGQVMSKFKETLGDQGWLKANESGLKKLLPETWTHVSNLNMLKIGFGLKLLNVDWRSREDLANIMAFLTRTRFILMDDMLVRANPAAIFSER